MLVKFKYRVFFDEKTGYSVCQYKSTELGTITCVGSNLPTTKNITYDFDAEKQSGSRYKNSYTVHAFKEYVNKTQEDIINYLSCGLFPGISKSTAEKIYNAFGINTIDILDHDIDRLSQIKGIGKKTLAKIKYSYKERTTTQEVAKQLTKYGITANICSKVSKAFGVDALNIIHDNPYRLCSIRGITFPIADAIARDHSMAPTAYVRIQAASDYVLKEDLATGNVCMPKIAYAIRLIEVLNTPFINKTNILSYVLEMMKDGTVCYNKRITIDGKTEYFYYPKIYKIERDIAARIRNMLKLKKRNTSDIDSLITKYETLQAIKLDDTQKAAVQMGVNEPLFIITGGPGTGKTTILKFIALINQDLGCTDNNVFLSPTGRAARHITESTGYPAQTIHSALRLGYLEDDVFGSSSSNEYLLEDANVIVDEASMIDLFVMDSLLKNLKNSSLGLIGDIDQLPSVRCGSILRDMIAAKIIPCIHLNHIHRQSSDAQNICKNAYNIKMGLHTLNEGYDFEIIESGGLEDTENKMLYQALHQINLYGIDNVKVLCPYRRGVSGVYRMNCLIQDKLNPRRDSLELKIPEDMVLRSGDPVMQLKNIKEVSNGDIGYIELLTENEVIVKYSKEVIVTYSYLEAKEQLTLAYATTVHKSQGSEYDAVILCMTEKHGIMKRRNILYTAITRGKHKVTLIGDKTAFNDAIDNNMIEDRHSMLSELISPQSEIIKKNLEKCKPDQPVYTQMVLPFVV